MPTKVSMVRWQCPQCKKWFWLKPADARTKKFCTRRCYYDSLPIANPVRAKRANIVVRYGNRTCPIDNVEFEAKTKSQTYCSQPCATKAIQDRRRGAQVNPRPCEYCNEIFTPRKGSAGRFCSFEHKNLGQRGEKASSWKGGRHVTKEGYVKVQKRGHPKASGNGSYVSEHIIVMEERLGRYLYPFETVHHKDGNRSNNNVNNLQLRIGNHGKGASFKCGDCGSFNMIANEI